MYKLYDYLCRKTVAMSNQANGGGAWLIALAIIAVLVFFTVTSPQFHGIHFKK